MKLTPLQNKRLKRFAEQKDIKFIVLFGSQAMTKGSHKSKKGSDYDIAVSAKNFNIFKNYTNMLYGLSEILNIPSERIDLTNLNSSDPLLRYEIVLNGKLLYGDETDYEKFKVYALRLYIDTQRLRELEKAIIIKRQRLLAEKIYA